MYPKSTRDRFWAKVRKTSGCWIWTAHCLPQGYGQFALTCNKPVKAHRFAYEVTYGAIPAGLMVCHRCDNPSCVRPKHLFLGTAKDNTHDSIRKSRAYVGQSGPSAHKHRYPKGERCRQAKLTEDNVRHIIASATTKTRTELAKSLGVSIALVCAILKGRAWRHITGLSAP
jgi:hypothetical protein